MDFQHKPAPRLTYAQKARAGLLPKKERKPMSSKGRGSLRPMSEKRAGRMKKYIPWVKAEMALVTKCARCPTTHGLEAHHPYGRHNERTLFMVVPLCQDCHFWTHHISPDGAYAEGWLQPEYRGLRADPEHPVPFKLLPGPAQP